MLKYSPRVLNDSGEIVDATSVQNLYNAIKSYQTDVVIALPVSGRKVSKIYSLIPSNGLADFTFSRNSIKCLLGANGLLHNIAVNIPPFNYNPVTSKWELYIEPQRTNHFLYSQAFSNAVWIKTNVVSSNGVASPTGALDANIITEASDVAQAHYWNQTIVKPTATALTYSFSVFVKRAVGTRDIRLTFNDGTTTNRALVFFNTATGAITQAPSVQGTFTNPSARSTAYADGWFRYELTATTGAEANIQAQILMTDGLTTAYNGNGTSALHIWGAQVSAGNAASSIIKTEATIVTRVADVATVPMTNGATYTIIYRLNGSIVVDYQVSYTGTSYQLPEGKITSFVIFNRQLTAGEITDLTTNLP